MINPDGVFSGYYRTNAAGYDLNRSYYEPGAQTPESGLVKQLFEELIGPERPENITSFDRSYLN